MKGGSGTYAVGKDASGNEVGYVFVTVSKGYGGDVKIMTGIDKNGAVTGISPLELNETAGLGMKARMPVSSTSSRERSRILQSTKTVPPATRSRRSPALR